MVHSALLPGFAKHALLNAILQPEQFVEIGESLANKLGIAQGDTVKVSSNRGYIKAKAVVTKRIRTLKANGKDIDTIGIPIHWGYEGVAKKGFIANTLTRRTLFMMFRPDQPHFRNRILFSNRHPAHFVELNTFK